MLQIFYMFTPAWGDDPIWPIFFKWVETTNLQVSLHFGTVSIAIIKWGWTLPQLSKSSAISNVRSNINMMRSVPSVFLYPYVHRRTPSYTPKHLEVISKTLLVQTNIWVYCQGHCSSSFCLPKHQCVSVYHHIINAPILSPYNPPSDEMCLPWGMGEAMSLPTAHPVSRHPSGLVVLNEPRDPQGVPYQWVAAVYPWLPRSDWVWP